MKTNPKNEGILNKKEWKIYVSNAKQKAGLENDLDKLLTIQEKIDEIDMEILSIMEEWEDMEKELLELKNGAQGHCNSQTCRVLNDTSRPQIY